jgi:iron complex transport system substrate-binding protein
MSPPAGRARAASLLVVALLAACGGDKPSGGSRADARAVRDCAGVDVSLPPVVRRVVTTAPGLTKTVVALGMGAALAGVSDQDAKEGALAALPRFAVYPTIPAESVAVLEPDVLLVDQVLSGKSVDALRTRFPATFVTDSSSSLARLRETFLRVAEALGVPHRGRLLAEELDRARSSAKVNGRPRVLVLGQVEPLPPYAIGPGGLLGDMLASVGAENVVWDLKAASGPVASELVVDRAPLWILHTDPTFPDALRRAWGSVPALSPENPGHVVSIAAEEFQQGGPGTAHALGRLAEILGGSAGR